MDEEEQQSDLADIAGQNKCNMLLPLRSMRGQFPMNLSKYHMTMTLFQGIYQVPKEVKK